MEEREKLFRKIHNYPNENGGLLADTSTISQTSSAVSINSPSASCAPASTDNLLSKISTDNSTSDQPGVGTDATLPFSDIYQIPLLPIALIKDVQDGILDKFRPHCSNRQILIDTVAYDLIENYNLL